MKHTRINYWHKVPRDADDMRVFHHTRMKNNPHFQHRKVTREEREEKDREKLPRDLMSFDGRQYRRTDVHLGDGAFSDCYLGKNCDF